MSIVARPQTGVIYGLIDPRPERNGQIRYIGQSRDFRKRKRNYLTAIQRGEGHNPALRNWFAKLQRAGLTPQFRILEECLFDLDAAEKAWIDKGKAKGWPLLNCREGGIGGVLSTEAKKRISEITQAKWADPIYRERWQRAHEKRWGGEAAVVARHAKHRANVAHWKENMRKAAERKAARQNRGVLVPLICGNTAFIRLTQGKWAMVDLQDWGRVTQYQWAAQYKGGYWRAKRTVNRKPLAPGTELLNRFVMLAVAGQMVTHRNGNQLDCRKSNLAVLQQASGAPRLQLTCSC